MKLDNTTTTFAVTAAFAGTAMSAYIAGEPWTTLTPSKTYENGLTDFGSTFGIAVMPVTTQVSSSATPVAKRDLEAVSQIGDGQIQATTKTTAPAISQIDDGQIQATTKTTAPAISQIDDGQIQATTKTTAPAISQIDDGQIQATTKTTAPAISQIDDGQIQATTKTTAPAISQIDDGQIQATTKTTTTLKPSEDPVSQIGDGQIQATGTPSNNDGQDSDDDETGDETETEDSDDPIKAVSCKNNGTLQMLLKDSVLVDAHGRIGSIVANRQFQFDGPPPQAGTIFAKGWSLTPEGNLAIGDNDLFYQCLSGTFYNLYDESIGAQCSPVHLQAIELIDC
ncbi:uncharacterized protein Ecym_5166 [Eremothecium cymbalariae DBVPG|uniref:Cell wall mannoprotein PIR1-like C-terminal domain-containing protein n=1 Tax=Eremothecium cymbalariae (strain CBS 270.75 / DBVPG 7215 / KCTC 17166 / NRRL Y-17582) TaxID=931890 RepID=I6NCZ8_ERECY|nr:hypothetical protein Ecym_5166 [Eremothecium cymbalariae DBVPG\